MEKEELTIPSVTLEWHDWVSWDELMVDSRGGFGVLIPAQTPGVYEAKYTDTDERLTIGRASDLRFRVKQGLVRGKTQHSAGEKIRAHEDVSRIGVRWAVTDRPAAVEEELHLRHRNRFGRLPKYVDHT